MEPGQRADGASTEPTAGTLPPRGWYPDPYPGRPGTLRWWNGTQWTPRRRRRAAHAARRRMALLASAGTLVTLAGIPLTFLDTGGDYCTDGEAMARAVLPYLPLWLVLVGLLVAAGRLHRTEGEGDRLMTTLLQLGVLAVIATCPFWLFAALGADCGL